jgi:hypothetical protein
VPVLEELGPVRVVEVVPEPAGEALHALCERFLVSVFGFWFLVFGFRGRGERERDELKGAPFPPKKKAATEVAPAADSVTSQSFETGERASEQSERSRSGVRFPPGGLPPLLSDDGG